jgi:iron(III) transport system ATP-binding protein
LFPHLSVGDNVAFGLPRAERKRSSRVASVLELVGLDESYAPRRPQELSGGEQRRVSLARALAPQPRLVLLDEPFSGLDAALRTETRAAVQQALAEQTTTALLVTHDQAEALSMGREVAVLRGGRLVQCADPTTLYRKPVDLDVARFVGDAVVVPGQADGDSVTCVLGVLALAHAPTIGAVYTLIRPEQIRISRTPPGAAPSPGRGVAARVVGHTYFGPDTVVQLALGEAGVPTITARSFDHDLPDVGEAVSLVVVGPVVAYPVTGD